MAPIRLANTDLFKNRPRVFLLALTVFEILTARYDLENVGQGHDVQDLQWHCSMAHT